MYIESMKIIDTRTGKEWIPPKSAWVSVPHNFGPRYELLVREGFKVGVLKDKTTGRPVRGVILSEIFN